MLFIELFAPRGPTASHSPGPIRVCDRGYAEFREPCTPEARLPRRPPLGNSVNKVGMHPRLRISVAAHHTTAASVE